MDGYFVYEYNYVKLLFSFLYGLYISVLRSNVMSRKSTTFLLASIVICKLLRLMILHISFFLLLLLLAWAYKGAHKRSKFWSNFDGSTRFDIFF